MAPSEEPRLLPWELKMFYSLRFLDLSPAKSLPDPCSSMGNTVVCAFLGPHYVVLSGLSILLLIHTSESRPAVAKLSGPSPRELIKTWSLGLSGGYLHCKS